MEQLEALWRKKKKAKERLDRVKMKLLKKRLQRIRDQLAAVAGTSAVQKPPVTVRPALCSPLLTGATNGMTSSSVTNAKHQLPACDKLIARRLRQSSTTSGGCQQLKVTVPDVPNANNESVAGRKCNNDVNNAGQTTATENVTQLDGVSHGMNCNSLLGKR